MAATLIQSVGNNNGGGSTTLVYTIAASATGSAIALALGPRGNPTISSVSDNINGTTGWTAASISNPDPVGVNAVLGYYNLRGISGVTTITVTFSASAICGGFAHEMGGIDSYIGGSESGNGFGAVTSFSSGGVACSGACLGLGWTSTGTTGLSFTPGSGWSNASGTGISSGSDTNGTDGNQIYGETQIFSGSGTNAADGTSSSATQISGAMFFLAAAAGGGGSSDQALLMLL